MSKREEMEAYLPPMLNRLIEMKEIFGTEAEEFQQLNDLLFDITDQLFIPTATWGLDRWEDLLSTDRDSSDDIYVRRNRIISQISNFPSTTYKTLERTIDRYLMNPSTTVRSTPGRPHFIVNINGYDLQYGTQIIQQLERMKPAHLAYTFRALFKEHTDNLIQYKQKLKIKAVQPYWDKVSRGYLDGSHKLDGSWRLNGFSEKEIHNYYQFLIKFRSKIKAELSNHEKMIFRAITDSFESKDYGKKNRFRTRVGFFDMLPVYLDGVYNLDGTFSLDGYDNRYRRQLFGHKMLMKMISEQLMQSRVKQKVRSQVQSFENKDIQWRKMIIRVAVGFFGFVPVSLNGRHYLDGSWYLNGTTDKYPRQVFANKLKTRFKVPEKQQTKSSAAVRAKVDSLENKDQKQKQIFHTRLDFFGVLPIYLNGVDKLDGNWYLNGFNKLHPLLFRQKVTFKSVVRVPTNSKGVLTVRKNWWTLDGSVKLDGTKFLNATSEKIAL
ncbi:putative phage tail protein [Alkalicoccobacillus gibsonii]|uniref:putative phage tail protein n=1 Tax=Alkalicoccobacillus gibsonii TaxID=79881 RepID=UPI0019325A7F|nr:putative phage tail protein [Alkalicoccobacillus gibsonii]MBM0064921.1 DUF2313 domain-containing protein [Alkalicoccobacillus gibsonii]